MSYCTMTRPYITRRGTQFMAAPALAAGLLSLGVGGCGLTEEEPRSSDAVLILLADLTPSGILEQDAQRRHIDDVVIPLAVEHDANVVLAVIDDAALVDPEPRGGADFDRAAAQGNQVAEQKLVAQARRDLVADVDALFTGAASHPSRGSDVAGAVAWAADTLRVDAATTSGSGNGEGTWYGLAVLSDAISTIPPCAMTSPPMADVEAAISACFAGSLPDLRGTEVWFLGAGVMPDGEPPPVDVHLLEAFWAAVVERGGGSFAAFAPTVLGPTPLNDQGGTT